MCIIWWKCLSAALLRPVALTTVTRMTIGNSNGNLLFRLRLLCSVGACMKERRLEERNWRLAGTGLFGAYLKLASAASSSTDPNSVRKHFCIAFTTSSLSVYKNVWNNSVMCALCYCCVMYYLYHSRVTCFLYYAVRVCLVCVRLRFNLCVCVGGVDI